MTRQWALLSLLLACHAPLAQELAPPIEPEPADPQPESAPAELDPEPETKSWSSAMERVTDLRQRLTSLDGSDALVYLELAEEVASETGSREDRDLARELYAVAYDLERATRARPEVMVGACLGLAVLEPTDDGSAWMIAVASLLDPRTALGDGPSISSVSVSPQVALDAANALGLARAGKGRRARRLYDQPAVKQVFERYGGLLGGSGGLSGVSRFERSLSDWPDSECGGTRMIMRRGENGVEMFTCPTCRGNPGPPLSEEEFLNHLRFESRLLRGIQQSWGAQIAADGGAPLLDPDPDRVTDSLAARYGIDASRRVWREGTWLEGEPQTQDPIAPEDQRPGS